jgi:predicted DNA-binding protein
MTKYTAFRCPEDLLAKAKIKALRDRRSLSNYLITLIEKDVADIEDVPLKKATRPAVKKARR